MKKNIATIAIFLIVIATCVFSASNVYAEVSANTEKNTTSNSAKNNENAGERVISNETESTLVQLKEKELKSMEDYQERYGSKSYGTTAYILHKVQIYSIPFCFLGIAIGAIHQYIIGIRKLDTLEKGMGLIVTFVTLLVICQVLPLAFAVFVKFGRG
mgnify:CR=1 FL=1